ncbi:MAG: hypothetical protein WA970_14160, partial [Gammaproteobacteria bacterium]
ALARPPRRASPTLRAEDARLPKPTLDRKTIARRHWHDRDVRPEFRADWNPEWNPGRRWTAPRYFRFRVRGEARPERIRNLVSSGATREGASASLTKSVLLRAECSSDSQLSASSRDAGTRESATAGVGHLGGLENR